MPLGRLFAPFLVLAILLCFSASSAQTAPAELDLDPCRQVAFAKSIVKVGEDNPSILETLGLFQLACGIANSVHKDVTSREAICALELSAGDAFVSAAGVQLTAYFPSASPQDVAQDQSVRRLEALRDWNLARTAYARAAFDCTLANGPASSNQQIAREKNFDSGLHISELVRQIASE